VIVKVLKEKPGPIDSVATLSTTRRAVPFRPQRQRSKASCTNVTEAPFDQGALGSCTGNAMAGVLMTDPIWVPGRNLTEVDAVKLYKAATKLDNVPRQLSTQ